MVRISTFEFEVNKYSFHNTTVLANVLHFELPQCLNFYHYEYFGESERPLSPFQNTILTLEVKAFDYLLHPRAFYSLTTQIHLVRGNGKDVCRPAVGWVETVSTPFAIALTKYLIQSNLERIYFGLHG